MKPMRAFLFLLIINTCLACGHKGLFVPENTVQNVTYQKDYDVEIQSFEVDHEKGEVKISAQVIEPCGFDAKLRFDFFDREGRLFDNEVVKEEANSIKTFQTSFAPPTTLESEVSARIFLQYKVIEDDRMACSTVLSYQSMSETFSFSELFHTGHLNSYYVETLNIFDILKKLYQIHLDEPLKSQLHRAYIENVEVDFAKKQFKVKASYQSCEGGGLRLFIRNRERLTVNNAYENAHAGHWSGKLYYKSSWSGDENSCIKRLSYSEQIFSMEDDHSLFRGAVFHLIGKDDRAFEIDSPYAALAIEDVQVDLDKGTLTLHTYRSYFHGRLKSFKCETENNSSALNSHCSAIFTQGEAVKIREGQYQRISRHVFSLHKLELTQNNSKLLIRHRNGSFEIFIDKNGSVTIDNFNG